MKKTFLIIITAILITGCQKSDADILGIVSTDEVENYFGTTVEVSYSDNTKMYFHLLSDTTAEVVEDYWFYTNQAEQTPWIYRGDVVIPDRFVHNGKTYKVTCIGEAAFKASVQNYELISLVGTSNSPLGLACPVAIFATVLFSDKPNEIGKPVSLMMVCLSSCDHSWQS